MISFDEIQKYLFLIIASVLYIFSFHKNGMMRPLYCKSKCSMNKRLTQVGGNIKDNINTVILAIISIFAIVSMFEYLNSVSIIFILASVVMIFAITGNLLFSVALSMILGSVIVSFTSTSSLEKFEEQKETENEKEKLKENDDKITSEDSVESEKFEFDHKNSFLENYKSLTKEQVNGLNKDTVDLMKTQEQLIATLKDMGPVLKESQTVLDTFKSYFGNDMTNKEMNDLLTNVKNTKL
jgi:hypothetical protein